MKKILRVLAVSVLALFLVSGSAMAIPITIDFGTGIAGTGGTVTVNSAGTVVAGTNIRIGVVNVSNAPLNNGTFLVTDNTNTLITTWGVLNFNTATNSIQIDGAIPGLALGYGTLLTGAFSSWNITESTSGLDFDASGPDQKAAELLRVLGIPVDTHFAYFGFSLTTADVTVDQQTGSKTAPATSTDIKNVSVPEPASMLLLGFGLLGLAGVGRKFKK